ncbi:hypothetical protein O6H91_18G060000 [Diphasiastrum complanatum]|uniref:Uncharacterized protein n=1 Tax=Diphasiastrum complanatum TaxID=34168 RepID=A0ACC2B1T9_DIPCM|nr:hypothetical protein O6H91_18G060000 [Diphasiastrum complanatum]
MTASNATSASGEASSSSDNGDQSGNAPQQQNNSATSVPSAKNAVIQPPGKKRRNLPGTPDPDAEVIALSPKTLMATNRFVCEICGKGFQRDQNLQLHRRGHNLPWKLRQRTSDEPRKRVYICPEVSCVHHDPSRALGDLTGIKKHFCRKHGEKKWKCDKCNKRYAVQSDWKAHSKTCGTREYRCDCGTLFSRKDSFITHRAFCDALAEENGKPLVGKQGAPLIPHACDSARGEIFAKRGSDAPHGFYTMNMSAIQSDPVSILPKTGLRADIVGVSFGGQGPMLHSSWARGMKTSGLNIPAAAPRLSLWSGPGSIEHERANVGAVVTGIPRHKDHPGQNGKWSAGFPVHPCGPGSLSLNPFSSGVTLPGMQTSNSGQGGANAAIGTRGFSDLISCLDRTSATAGLSLSSPHFAEPSFEGSKRASSFPSANRSCSTQMSATALLQKAAQMGATSSNSSLLRGFPMSLIDSSNFDMSTFWQGARQDQEKTPGMPNISAGLGQPLQSQSQPSELSAKSTGTGKSSGSSSFAALSRSTDQSSNQDSTTTSTSGYASLFGGGLTTFPPISATQLGKERVSQSRDVSGSIHVSAGGYQQNGKLPLSSGPSGAVCNGEDGADKITLDFLGGK